MIIPELVRRAEAHHRDGDHWCGECRSPVIWGYAKNSAEQGPEQLNFEAESTLRKMLDIQSQDGLLQAKLPVIISIHND